MGRMKEMLDKFSKLKYSGAILAAIFIGMALIIIPFDAEGSDLKDSSPEDSISELCERICKSDIYVTVNTNDYGEVSGVALVLEGGDSPEIRLKLTEAVSTLYSLSSSKIYVTAPIK